MKKIILLLVLLITVLSINAEESGSLNDNISWTLTDDGTLTISGTGNMPGDAPLFWDYRDKILVAVIEDGVTSIGNYAFYYCSGLTSVTIPNSVTSIGDKAFYKCSGLTSVTIPNSVTSIGNSAFNSCSSLTSVTIGNSVTSIGQEAFYGCKGLTSVTIPNSVTSISNRAFEYCKGLNDVYVSCKDVEDFGKYVSRTDIHSVFCSSSSGLSGKTHHILIDGKEQKEITIPNSVTSIGSYAFRNCSGLTSVTIPNSVTSIGYRAFRGCM